MHDKILIVDDEKDIVAMLGSFFESKGFLFYLPQTELKP